MDELVKIVQQLVSKRGIDILLDKNLYNIINDLSSTVRGNHSYQSIIKVIAQDGLMRTILVSDVINRPLAITSLTKTIKTTYWLDLDDSTRLLCALSLGAGLIDQEECEQILFGKKRAENKTEHKKQQNQPAHEEPQFFVNGVEIETLDRDNSPKREEESEHFMDLSDIADIYGNASGTFTTKNTEIAIDPHEPFTNYVFPSVSLLENRDYTIGCNTDEIKFNNNEIVGAFLSFGIKVVKINAIIGSSSILHELTLEKGTRYSKINRLKEDIIMSIPMQGVQLFVPIQSRTTVGVLVPRRTPSTLSICSVLNSNEFIHSSLNLPLALGRTITGNICVADLSQLPHILIAGSNRTGKTTCIKSLITSLLFKKHPNGLKFVIINSTKVEYAQFNLIAPHFMAALPEYEDDPIIVDDEASINTLNSLCKLMDNRYAIIKKAYAKDINDYNDKFIHHKLNVMEQLAYMPYIVVIIDEFDDFIMTAGNEFQEPLIKLAQSAHAVGIHLILATNQVNSKSIPTTLKSNIPARIAFRVNSASESRSILGGIGAESLPNDGTMLFKGHNGIEMVQNPMINASELESITQFIANQPGPTFLLELPDLRNEEWNDLYGDNNSLSLDPYFDEAARAIVITQQGSTSMIQRRFSISYSRAGRLMDQLEKAGIVGPAQGSKPRNVLIQDENTLNVLLSRIHRFG